MKWSWQKNNNKSKNKQKWICVYPKPIEKISNSSISNNFRSQKQHNVKSPNPNKSNGSINSHIRSPIHVCQLLCNNQSNFARLDRLRCRRQHSSRTIKKLHDHLRKETTMLCPQPPTRYFAIIIGTLTNISLWKKCIYFKFVLINRRRLLINRRILIQLQFFFSLDAVSHLHNHRLYLCFQYSWLVAAVSLEWKCSSLCKMGRFLGYGIVLSRSRDIPDGFHHGGDWRGGVSAAK